MTLSDVALRVEDVTDALGVNEDASEGDAVAVGAGGSARHPVKTSADSEFPCSSDSRDPTPHRALRGLGRRATALRASVIVDAQPIGALDSEGRFSRGGHQIAIPPASVRLANRDELAAIFGTVDGSSTLVLGSLSFDDAIQVPMNGDVFFGRHVGVVGSTGSGKSCTVAKILQEAMEPGPDGRDGPLGNAHTVIFDLHGEYSPAFPQGRVLSIDNLQLPYWLMTAEELEELFIAWVSGWLHHPQDVVVRHRAPCPSDAPTRQARPPGCRAVRTSAPRPSVRAREVSGTPPVVFAGG